jgi:hypothetical protein
MAAWRERRPGARRGAVSFARGGSGACRHVAFLMNACEGCDAISRARHARQNPAESVLRFRL